MFHFYGARFLASLSATAHDGISTTSLCVVGKQLHSCLNTFHCAAQPKGKAVKRCTSARLSKLEVPSDQRGSSPPVAPITPHSNGTMQPSQLNSVEFETTDFGWVRKCPGGDVVRVEGFAAVPRRKRICQRKPAKSCQPAAQLVCTDIQHSEGAGGASAVAF